MTNQVDDTEAGPRARFPGRESAMAGRQTCVAAPTDILDAASARTGVPR